MMKVLEGSEKEHRDQFISTLLFNCIKNIDLESAEKVKFNKIILLIIF